LERNWMLLTDYSTYPVNQNKTNLKTSTKKQKFIKTNLRFISKSRIYILN